jgi:hypothetical protein
VPAPFVHVALPGLIETFVAPFAGLGFDGAPTEQKFSTIAAMFQL